MENIDRKFSFNATHNTKGTVHTEEDSVLFLAKDKLLPDLLGRYEHLCTINGVGSDQIIGVRLLRARVEEYQKNNPEIVKLPDIDEGDEESAVCGPNIIEEDFVDGLDDGEQPYNESAESQDKAIEDFPETPEGGEGKPGTDRSI